MKEEDLRKVVNLSRKCKLGKEYNIIIEENKIFLEKNDIVLISKNLDFNTIGIDQVNFPENNPYKDDASLSPLEADWYKRIWVKKWNRINFPPFVNTILFCVLICGRIPTYEEVCLAYLEAHTKPSDKIPDPSLKVSKTQYKTLGESFLVSGKQITNMFIEFSSENSGLPENVFTVGQLFYRIYKVYCSIVRDIYNPLFLHSKGIDTTYSYKDDMAGIDLLINKNIPVYSYVVGRGSYFRFIKKNWRHEIKSDVGFEIITSRQKGNGIVTLDEDVANIIKKHLPTLDSIVKIQF